MDNNEDNDDNTLDPRIQIELEKLNTATDEINRLEVELDEANTTFRILQNECTRRITVMKAKLGSCIQKARPYYDALEVAKEAQLECQKAAVQFQRANEIHQAAKETVALAEQRFFSKQHEWQFDNAWQEMLNHATIKVRDAETQKAECGREHQIKATIFHTAEQKVQQLEQRLGRHINKSRPYFEEKDVCIGQLSAQKERIETLEKQVAAMKESYAASLKQLEAISEEIHRKRNTNISRSSLDPLGVGVEPPTGPREPGVGAELSPVYTEEPCRFFEKDPSLKPLASAKPAEDDLSKKADVETKDATEDNCDNFYFEPTKSPARANHTPLPLLDNLAFVRKSVAADDRPEAPVPYPASGFAPWAGDIKAELDKYDLASLGSMSVATGSSAVSERGDGEEDEDLEDFQTSLGLLSLRGPGTGVKSKSLPSSPNKTCASLNVDCRCLTPPPSPVETAKGKSVFPFKTSFVKQESKSSSPVVTAKDKSVSCAGSVVTEAC